MHKETQGIEKQNLEMRMAYKIPAMKFFTPDEGRMQI